MSKTLNALKVSRSLIARPASWTKGEAARDAENGHVSVLSVDAVCFCALGALDLACKKTGAEYAEVLPVLAAALSQDRCDQLFTNACRIINFNDDDSTTHEKVLMIFDRAIASLENA